MRHTSKIIASSFLLSSLHLPLVVHAADAPVGKLHVEPQRFSPNADGVKDDVAIELVGGGSGTLKVWIRNSDGRTVDRQILEAPVRSLTWDGKRNGRVVPDGRYTLDASLDDGAGNLQTFRRTVAVDTEAPRVRLKGRVLPIAGKGRHEIGFRASDVDPRLTLWGSYRRLLGQRVGQIPSANHNRLGTLRWKQRKVLMPGTFEMQVRAKDRAGNLSRPSTLRWRVHRTVRPRVISRVTTERSLVALTFDDCVFRDSWTSILDTLRQRRAKGTFFCPADQMLGKRDLVLRTVREGHSIGAHGGDHARLPAVSDAGIRSRMLLDRKTWWRLGRATSAPFMRPPYGAYDARVLRISGETSHPFVVMWDVDTSDWRGRSPSQISSHVVRNSRPGSIVLMHVRSNTAAAVNSMITGLRSRGLQPVSLDALLGAGGVL